MRPLRAGVVMVAGAFDPLHEGHRFYFEQARSFGTHLVCVVARNRTIERYKHRVPWQDERERLRVIMQEPLVDEVVLGHHVDPFTSLERIRPEVICVGYDQQIFTQRMITECAMRGLAIRIERVDALQPQLYKSSFSRTLCAVQ